MSTEARWVLSSGGFVARVRFVAVSFLAGVLCLPGMAAASHGSTELISAGPAGGSGATAGVYRGASEDGTRVFFQTTESLVSADTDSAMDVYERSGGGTTLLTTGPNGGNGSNSATFGGASADGAHVFFRTAEKLVGSDTDSAVDIYERFNGQTTLVSTGPSGGDGAFNAIFDAVSKDGSRVLFDTNESLVGADTDSSRDVYESSGGTTTSISTSSIGGNGAFDAFYRGASEDATHVFFSTDEPLAGTDFDQMEDVYERSGGSTTHLSIGPAGGNGNIDFDYDAFFDGASADGSRVWLHTDEVLVAGDTDDQNDVYERAGGGIGLVSAGPGGGNGSFGAFLDGASKDGSHVFFDTQESLAGSDTDAAYDIYDRTGGGTMLVSTGPNGGSGNFYAAFQRASDDGSRVFFHSSEALVSGDLDSFQDVYERSGGQTTLVSTGPTDAGAGFPATFDGASADGTRVFFDTAENLVSAATDTFPDIYERTNGDTTLLSIGPIGGNGDYFATFRGASKDGARVFYETDEPLVSADTDTSQDVYSDSVVNGYARPKGATPILFALVPSYNACTAPNRTHAPPLAGSSCNPPAQASSYLTVGTGDANGKTPNSIGSVRLDAVAGIASTPADEANVKITTSVTDVRLRSDLSDYAGQLQLVPTIRITDKLNGSLPADAATVMDVDFPVTVPCTATADTAIGSSCAITTTADSVLPAVVTESKRTIWQMTQFKVLDGGADGLAATSGNTVFETRGLFVP
jgi:hypothetical protein